MDGATNPRSNERRAKPKDRLKVRGKHIEILCGHGSRALSDFLRRMKEHNAEVVFPSSRKHQRRAA